MDKELLEAISQMMDSKLSPINERLDKIQDDITEMKSDIDILKEDSKITRSAVNNLLDWAEEAQVQVKIPLFRKAAE